MRREWLGAVIAVFLVSGESAWVPTARAQTVVLTARSVGELADDLNELARAVAPADERVGMVSGMIDQLKKGELVKGLDTGRLVGVAGSLPENPGDPPSLLAAVPVTDFAQFMDSLKGFGLTVDDAGVPGFAHKIVSPDGTQTFYALEANKYAIVSMVPTGAEKLKALDPASWRPTTVADSDLALAVQIAKIPAGIKDQFLTAFEAQVAQQDPQKPGESDAEYRGRMASTRLAKEAVISLIRDGDSVSLGLNLDRQKREASLELTSAAKAGTSMATALRGFGARRSRFDFLAAGAPAGVGWLSIPIPAELKAALTESIRSEHNKRQETLKGEEKTKDARAFERFEKLVDMDAADLGVAFRAPGDPSGKPSIVLGLKVKPADADKAFRELMADAPPEKGTKLDYDVAKADDGTAIHRITLADEALDKDTIRMFGKAPVHLAFPGNAMIVTFAENGLDAIKEAVAAFKRAPAGPGSPGSVELHLLPASRLAEENAGQVREAATETFKGEDAGRDSIRFSLKGDDQTIRLRFAVDYPAFAYLAKLGSLQAK
ncbi:hypothetical protein [Aquisphaera insulae]|uniref:hypothetical protein n=1 Tax=Aquisphaera insulae TaxID=2712864 RepID=UPI0013EC99AC|nr:hypothetical protein [Aquisphaera insulae]